MKTVEWHKIIVIFHEYHLFDNNGTGNLIGERPMPSCRRTNSLRELSILQEIQNNVKYFSENYAVI